jgi:hypothetical protein
LNPVQKETRLLFIGGVFLNKYYLLDDLPSRMFGRK